MGYVSLKSEEGKCPKCGCRDLEYGCGETVDTGYAYEVVCLSCEWHGKEWHRLVFDCYSEETPE